MYWDRTIVRHRSGGESTKDVYEKVNPEGHERVLLDDIKAMQAEASRDAMSNRSRCRGNHPSLVFKFHHQSVAL